MSLTLKILGWRTNNAVNLICKVYHPALQDSQMLNLLDVDINAGVLGKSFV